MLSRYAPTPVSYFCTFARGFAAFAPLHFVLFSTIQPFNESTESAGFAGYFPKYFSTAFTMPSRAVCEWLWPLGISL